jgi:hypothetical protein
MCEDVIWLHSRSEPAVFVLQQIHTYYFHDTTPFALNISCFSNMNNPVRKRRRPAVACTECRRRKVKCDRSLPCASCVLGTLACAYNSPDVPPQDLRPLANSAIDADFNWNLLPSVMTPNGNLQRLYGHDIQSSDTPILSVHDTNYHVPNTSSTIRHRADIIDSSEERLHPIPRPLEAAITSPSSPNIQDVPTSTKSSLSRGTHLTPNHWKSVFKEVGQGCYYYFASPTRLTLRSRFKRIRGLNR